MINQLQYIVTWIRGDGMNESYRGSVLFFLIQGEFETLDHPRMHFGPTPRGFTECRGVVVRGKSGHVVSLAFVR